MKRPGERVTPADKSLGGGPFGRRIGGGGEETIRRLMADLRHIEMLGAQDPGPVPSSFGDGEPPVMMMFRPVPHVSPDVVSVATVTVDDVVGDSFTVTAGDVTFRFLVADGVGAGQIVVEPETVLIVSAAVFTVTFMELG